MKPGRRLPCAATFVALIAAGAAAAKEPVYKQLSAKQIHARIVGMGITDDAHWSDYIFPGGVLVSYDLGRKKNGTWMLEGDELCLTRAGKKESATDCFEIWVSGDTMQYRRGGYVVADGFIRPIPKEERP